MDNVKARFKQYQNAVEESNIVSKTDINGIITFVNDEFCKISEYTREELIGKNHNIVRHPDVPKESFRRLWSTILDKKVYKTIAKNLTKSGKVVYLNTTIIPILNLKGDIEEFLAIRHDVTKVIELNEQLLKTQDELEILNSELEERVRKKTAELRALNENLQDIIKSEVAKNEEQTKLLVIQSRFASMGEMIANIAHQWRQPLNELSIALFKMKKTANNSDEEFENSYRRCKNIIKNMSNTIEDFRGFFAVDKEAKKFHISSSVHDSIFMLQGAIEREEIDLKLNIINDVEIYGHKRQLDQVVINLLNNAKDALIERKVEDKTITVEVLLEENFGVLKISDNAGGIDEHVKDKIFEPYFTTKHSSSGTGIGLYMSKLIIDRANGEITAENTASGACFIVRLPIQGEFDE
ncbi:PAS domain-containing sensor histidine kinase [Campylobacter californiensis]|uniref:PAS domain-containing sensor histidine kinase n=1 Tax=Campylobacter californiensis TaxID=1032243 RepID=UPI0014730F29|nr:PAS domain-containing sensor histidine kinase [Campylobacter sp. RM12916]MBE3609552.1 PAS domain-containing sensor histidine kinase [Campylobacter sp. RM12916]